MVQERVTGNGNFDIDAIRAAANAMEGSNAATPQVSAQPAVDAFAAEVEEMTDDIRFNPSTNLAEEAAQILNSPLVARLDSGVLMNLRAAVNLQEEKQENGSAAFMRGDTWVQRRERDQKDRDEKANAAKIADDIQDIQQQQEQQRQQRAEAWRNDEHEYAGKRMTGAEWMQMIQWFRTPENRTQWEDAMMAETGQSREEVRATGTRMDRYFDLMEKQARGEVLAPDEQAEFNSLDRDPEIRRGVTTMQNLQANRLGADVSINAGSANLDGGLRNGVTATATDSRFGVYGDEPLTTTRTTSVAAEIDGRNATASPSALSANFNAQAVGASTPPPPVPVQPAPQLAAASVQVDAGNMFG